MVLVWGYYEYGAKTVSLASGEEQEEKDEELLGSLHYVFFLYRVLDEERKLELRR